MMKTTNFKRKKQNLILIILIRVQRFTSRSSISLDNFRENSFLNPVVSFTSYKLLTIPTKTTFTLAFGECQKY